MTAQRGPVRAEQVVAQVQQRTGSPCARCAAPLLGHEVVLSLFLGFVDAPCCAACLAQRHARPREEFLRSARERIARLPCYRAGWEHADAALLAGAAWPVERLPLDCRLLGAGEGGDDPEGIRHSSAQGADAAVASYDAGDSACGELVLELRRLLESLAPGTVLHLVAQDTSASEDLPAWCRLTGHRLLEAAHPVYWIERNSTPLRKA